MARRKRASLAEKMKAAERKAYERMLIAMARQKGTQKALKKAGKKTR